MGGGRVGGARDVYSYSYPLSAIWMASSDGYVVHTLFMFGNKNSCITASTAIRQVSNLALSCCRNTPFITFPIFLSMISVRKRSKTLE